jgi:hypothetical protein
MSGTQESALPVPPSRLEKERSVMQMQRDERPRPAGSQAGFALILAILSLMLLTFLGLTLAATTSTELQIATNYRWSQQALYNAEAGLEAAKLVLAQVARVDASFRNILPAARTGSWHYGVTGATGGPPDPNAGTPARAGLRDYEMMGCAGRSGVGYGRILTVPSGVPQPVSSGVAAPDYQDVSEYMGTTLNGAFTLWVRRDTVVSDTGEFSDNADDTALVVTAEGVAPYTSQSTAFARANQARRILEVAYVLLVNQGNRCQGLSGQEGLAASGENFDPCSPLKASGVAAALGGAVLENAGVK